MILGLIVAMLIVTGYLLFVRDSKNTFVFIIFAVSIVFFALNIILLTITVPGSRASYCTEEVLTAKREAISVLKERGFNDKSISHIREWLDIIDEKQSHIDGCFRNARTAQGVSELLLIDGLIHDMIPEHLLEEKNS